MTPLRAILLPLALFAVACDSDAETEVDAEATEVHAADGEGRGHGKRFEKLDADKDGFVSVAEAQSHHKLAKHFTELDADNDGKLTKDELAAMKHKKGKRGGWHGKDPAERAAKLMSKLDADNDGTISSTEVQGHKIAEWFATADVNADGKLTREELVAFKSSHQRGDKERAPVP